VQQGDDALLLCSAMLQHQRRHGQQMRKIRHSRPFANLSLMHPGRERKRLVELIVQHLDAPEGGGR